MKTYDQHQTDNLFPLIGKQTKTSKKDEPSREMQKNCMTVAMLKVLQYFCRALAVFEFIILFVYGAGFF